MTQVNEKDVAAFKDWLAKEPTLPKNFEDNIIKKFLFSCNCSLERTKRCLEDFCTSRAIMSEIFTNRDPQSTRLKTAFDITNMTTYNAGVDELLIHRLNDAEKFDFYDILKSFMLKVDHWLRLEKDVLPENQIIILDIGVYTLMMVAKSNIFFYQKFLIFLLETMPVRLSQIHVVNCPSYYEYMYGLVKGAVPQETRDIIHFHTDHMALHKFIDKKYLPSEYDGDAGSMVEQDKKWTKEINQNSIAIHKATTRFRTVSNVNVIDQVFYSLFTNPKPYNFDSSYTVSPKVEVYKASYIQIRKFFLNDDLWKADISKKVKNGAVDTTMSGSFRTLAID